jgi:hypothetical protein
VKYLFLLGCASALAWAQPKPPVIGIIDYYGAKSFSPEKLRKELKIAEGEPLPGSRADLEEMLVALKGVVRANVEAVCCEDGKAIVYVGVEERGRAHLDIREEPKTEGLELPGPVVSFYPRVVNALGVGPEALETLQTELGELAEVYQKPLRQVMRESADPDDRAIAALVLGYAPHTQVLVDDLQYALRDPEQGVRTNAFKSLMGFAVYARKHPEAELRVLTTWFVEMLNSVSWQDRRNAMDALVELTDKRDEYLMKHMKDRGVPALLEMAQWRHLPHALPAYILLGRLAGMGEEEIQGSWSANQREEMIKKVRKKLKV